MWHLKPTCQVALIVTFFLIWRYKFDHSYLACYQSLLLEKALIKSIPKLADFPAAAESLHSLKLSLICLKIIFVWINL